MRVDTGTGRVREMGENRAYYPGNRVDLALAKQALDAAGLYSQDLALVPARLIGLVSDALTELSWRRDIMDEESDVDVL